MTAGKYYWAVSAVALLVAATAAFDASDVIMGEPRFAGYDPSAAYPFGRPHPDAAPKIRQFRFMIGENICIDTIPNGDGTTRQVSARWNASYFLNGHGVQDRYWANKFATSNIRIFDPASGTWKVTFFRMPGYFSGVWEGGMVEDRDMVLKSQGARADGTPFVNALIFFNITDRGFDWRSETIAGGETKVGWRSSCVKAN